MAPTPFAILLFWQKLTCLVLGPARIRNQRRCFMDRYFCSTRREGCKDMGLDTELVPW